MNDENNEIVKGKDIPGILTAIGSPLKLFALVIIFSNTVFGLAASEENFKFAIHMFLAIVGAMLLIALWSPRSLYHPVELKDIPCEKLPKEDPKTATLILCGALVAYMIYYTFIRLTS